MINRQAWGKAEQDNWEDYSRQEIRLRTNMDHARYNSTQDDYTKKRNEYIEAVTKEYDSRVQNLKEIQNRLNQFYKQLSAPQAELKQITNLSFGKDQLQNELTHFNNLLISFDQFTTDIDNARNSFPKDAKDVGGEDAKKIHDLTAAIRAFDRLMHMAPSYRDDDNILLFENAMYNLRPWLPFFANIAKLIVGVVLTAGGLLLAGECFGNLVYPVLSAPSSTYNTNNSNDPYTQLIGVSLGLLQFFGETGAVIIGLFGMAAGAAATVGGGVLTYNSCCFFNDTRYKRSLTEHAIAGAINAQNTTQHVLFKKP